MIQIWNINYLISIVEKRVCLHFSAYWKTNWFFLIIITVAMDLKKKSVCYSMVFNSKNISVFHKKEFVGIFGYLGRFLQEPTKTKC